MKHLSPTVSVASDSPSEGSFETISSAQSDSKKTKTTWLVTLYLAYQSLGAVYGDIGTSPLYTFSTIFPTPPDDPNDVLGACSCIFWGLTIVVLLKYCVFVFTFGPNNNEGGIVAIYAKISKHLKNGPRGLTDDLELAKSETRDSWMQVEQKKGWLKKVLAYYPLACCIFGSGLLLSDGLLTPTVSVLSAVEGITIPAPQMTDKTVLISCMIMLVLFFGQRFGSNAICMFFSPILVLWIVTIGAIGCINIHKDPSIFKIISPKYAVVYLRKTGIDAAGSVILALTGTEAMFADVGHFSPNAVRLAVAVLVYPCLCLAYIGQAACIIRDPTIVSNTFYNSIPGKAGDGLYWYVFVLAILSTIIASQAIILGVFSISRQLMALECMPKFPIVHTSSKYAGKVYIPVLNYFFMIACILSTVGFRHSANASAAYGLCVAMDFVITTSMVSIAMFYVYGIKWYFVLPFFLGFALLDMIFVASGMKKVPHGAWFPVVMAVIFTSIMALWRWGSSKKVDYEFEHRVSVRSLFGGVRRPQTVALDLGPSREVVFVEQTGSSSKVAEVTETELDVVAEVPPMNLDDPNPSLSSVATPDFLRYPGLTIFYSNLSFTLKSPNSVPPVIKTYLKSFPALADNVIFLAIQIAPDPFVSHEMRLTVIPVEGAPGLYRAVATFGFMERAQMTDKLVNDLCARVGYDYAYSADSFFDRVTHVFNKQKCLSRKTHVEGSFLRRTQIKLNNSFRSLLIDYIYGPVEYVFNASDRTVKLRDGQTESYVAVTTVARI